MIRVKFIIENGKPDSNGDILKIDGLKIPDEIALTKNFDNSNPIGFCDVFKEDDVLKAQAQIPDETINTYPAIGFQIVSSKVDENGVTIIDEAKLNSVSLCKYPNSNPSIKKISDQMM